MKRLLWIALGSIGLIGLGVLGWLAGRGPSPEEILAAIDIPPAPVRSAEEELSTFRIAPGFRVELVAAEPLVVDPVAMDWDDRGRLYVVEMRGYMPDVDAHGEQSPVGRVVLLEDSDGDGLMDESHVYLDELVLPRAIAVLPQGVLIGVPPDLVLCQDRDGDDRCSALEKRTLARYGNEPGNVEHRENALLQGLDGWIYNSKSSRRFRLDSGSPSPPPSLSPSPSPSEDEALEVDETLFRGQWGIAQDDAGNLYYNHNSAFLFVDSFPAEYALRQPATAAIIAKPGLNVNLAPKAQVYGVRVAPGLNRAYQPGSLRPDGRQDAPTAVSGLAIQRGDQFGEDFVGDAFIPESAGAAVAHFSIARDGLDFEATHRLYDDEDYGEREFLAATDERFRPVDAKVGPDGAIWIIDMYRGLIQHADFVSDHLREYVKRQGLEAPGATGRIWRIVRDDAPIDYRAPSLDSTALQLRGLDHANGWVRDRAQRELVYAADPEAIPALRRLGGFSSRGRRHALWALHGLGALDAATLRLALADPDPSIRALGLRTAESLLPSAALELAAAATQSLDDADPRVRLQALHTLGGLPLANRPLDLLLDRARQGSDLDRQAALSGIAGLERRALESELARGSGRDTDWIRALATAAYLAALNEPDAPAAATRFFDAVHTLEDPEIAEAALEGVHAAQQLPGHYRIVLARPHAIFDDRNRTDREEVLAQIRSGVTWPGDIRPGGARPLTPEEGRQREIGAALFAQTCATCHGEHGGGSSGLAPPLVRSPWVRDADAWLVRIALQGIRGPITVHGAEWNGSMPGHGHDPRFDDASLAGLLTHLRRSWGHADAPISAASVARIRAETRDHPDAWTAEELRALPIEHRLDRFVGTYRVPIVGIEIVIGRNGANLDMGRTTGGRAELTEIGDGLFTGEGTQIRFSLSDEGPAEDAELRAGENTITISRVER